MYKKREEEMTLNLTLLFSWIVVLFVVAQYLHRAAKRASMMTKEPTYSKSVNREILDVGIYTEHGMVLEENGRDVKAECKKSQTYYESFI